MPDDDDLEAIRKAVAAQAAELREATAALARMAKPGGAASITRASTSARMVAGYERSGSGAEQRAKRRALSGEFGPAGNRDEGGGDDGEVS